MKRDEGLINLITEWLEDQPERAPDQLLETVLIDLQTAPQRARWRLALRSFPMPGSNLARYGAVAGVAALALVVAVGLWAGRGLPVGAPGETTNPTPTSAAISTTAPTRTSAAIPTTTPAATAAQSPLRLRGQGLLAAGPYFHESDALRISLAVPAGWETIVANEVGKGLVEGPARVKLGFHQSVIVYVDPCQSEAGVKPTETVDDLATALADVPADVTLVARPTDTTIGGLGATHLVWSLKTDIPGERPSLLGCGMFPWQFASFAGPYEGGRHHDVWVLDVAGTQLVINAEYYLGDDGFYPETSDADRAELQAVIDSLQIEAVGE